MTYRPLATGRPSAPQPCETRAERRSVPDLRPRRASHAPLHRSSLRSSTSSGLLVALPAAEAPPALRTARPPGESTWVLHDYVQTPIRLTLKTCLPSGSPLPPVSQPGPGPGTILSPPRLRGLPTQRLASPLASVTGARGSRELANEEDKHAGPAEGTEHASVLLEARRRADGPLGSPAERAASVPRLEPNSEGVRSRSPCVPLLIRLLLMPEMDW